MTPRRVLALLLMLAMLTGCGLFGDGEPADQAPGAGEDPDELPLTGWSDVQEVGAGGVLRIGVSTLPDTFDPVVEDASVGPGTSDLERVLGPTTGGAVRITDDGGWEVDDNYAESVEVTDEDPLTVRVRLNTDAVWQDGEAIVAADMVAFHAYLSRADFANPAVAEGWDDIAAVEEGDSEHEYVVRFERPRSDWPRFVYPRLPRSVTDGEGDADFADSAVPSNGPFVITDIDRETGTITQERNPRWWGRTPRLEQVVWRVGTPQVQAEAYAADELDVIDVDGSSTEDVDAERLRRAAGSAWSHLTVNAGSGPLADADVRRALTLALDREAIASAALDGLDVPARVGESVFTVPGQEGHADVASELLEHDPAAAQKLLSDAGFEEGEGPELRFPVPAESPAVLSRARLVAEQLDAAGFRVEVEEVDADAFSEAVLVPRDFDLVSFSWDANLLGVAPAESGYRPVDSADNLTGVASGSREQWSASVGALEDEARHEATAELARVVVEQRVVIPLAVPPKVMAVREGVLNYGPSAFRQPDFTVVGFEGDAD